MSGLRVPWLEPAPSAPFPDPATALREPDGLLAVGGDLTVERLLNASPARVFAAYASLEAKGAWFKTPSDAETLDRDFDFRVGGRERFAPAGRAA